MIARGWMTRYRRQVVNNDRLLALLAPRRRQLVIGAAGIFREDKLQQEPPRSRMSRIAASRLWVQLLVFYCRRMRARTRWQQNGKRGSASILRTAPYRKELRASPPLGLQRPIEGSAAINTRRGGREARQASTYPSIQGPAGVAAAKLLAASTGREGLACRRSEPDGLHSPVRPVLSLSARPPRRRRLVSCSASNSELIPPSSTPLPLRLYTLALFSPIYHLFLPHNSHQPSLNPSLSLSLSLSLPRSLLSICFVFCIFLPSCLQTRARPSAVVAAGTAALDPSLLLRIYSSHLRASH